MQLRSIIVVLLLLHRNYKHKFYYVTLTFLHSTILARITGALATQFALYCAYDIAQMQLHSCKYQTRKLNITTHR